MIAIELALFAKLSSRYPAGGSGREPRADQVEDGTTVGEYVERIGLAEEQRITFVNGRHAADDRLLSQGDRLAIFPPIAGG
jgi:molybdopterin converting factor small subunit